MPSSPRLIDIAQAAGVSRAVVGHVLNGSGQNSVRVSEETRQRVIDLAEQMNYRANRAAQQLRGKPTNMLGVLLDTINTPVFSERLSHLEAEAYRRGYRLMIGQTHHDPKIVQEYLDDFQDRGIDAILCLFDYVDDLRPELKSIFQGPSKLVLHAAPILSSQACVRVDTAFGIRMLVDHLYQQGKRSIGMQLVPQIDRLMAVRESSWKESLVSHGLNADDQFIWRSQELVHAPNEAMIDQCVHHVQEQQLDAIIASNDEWAVRIVRGLKQAGIQVPTDVAVTGYDNLDLGEVIDPPLTTIDQAHDDYAVAAVDLMESLIEGKEPDSIARTIQPRLIIRKST